MKGSAPLAYLPTITDSFLLSFTFFILSDIHQILREPTLENLVRILTSLQFTANSPFDYPAFLFLIIVLINLVGILVSRLRNRRTRMDISPIPIARGGLSIEGAREDLDLISGLLKQCSDRAGIHPPFSARRIATKAEGLPVPTDRYSEIRELVSRILGEDRAADVQIHRSPLTDLLFRLSHRLRLPIGGMYHPVQHKISLSPDMNAVSSAHVFAHELFHSYNLGEVWAEIGSIAVCLRLGRREEPLLECYGLYVLLRSILAHIRRDSASGDPEHEDQQFSDEGGEPSFPVAWRQTRLESEVYVALKESELLVRSPTAGADRRP